METIRQTIGTDVRFFLEDHPPMHLPSAQAVVMGVDLAAQADMHAVHYVEWNGSAFVTPPPLELPNADDLDDFDHFLDFLYGDGSAASYGLLPTLSRPGDPANLPHPGHMTRQRRRAAARAASKGRTI